MMRLSHWRILVLQELTSRDDSKLYVQLFKPNSIVLWLMEIARIVEEEVLLEH